MAQYTKQEIIDILVKAGIPNKDIPIMVAIALAESMGNPEAIGDENLVNDKWDESIGLFQIRSLKNPNDPKFNKADKLRIKDKLFDPVYNAKAAYEISKKGKTWKDWTTFNEGTYKKFMSAGPSRSDIRLAGGGPRGRSKPITMVENEKSLGQEYKDLNVKINKLKSELKVLIKENKLVNVDNSVEIDSKQKELTVLEEERRKNRESSKEKVVAYYDAKENKKTQSKLKKIDEEIAFIERTGNRLGSIGQRGPTTPATDEYLNTLKAKRDEILNKPTESTEPTVPVAGSGGTAVKDTGTVLGEVKSDLPVGDGLTVNIGPIAGVEKVIRGRYGQPITLRPSETGVIETSAAIGRIKVLGPDGQKLKEQIRQLFIQNGVANPTEATIEKYWESAVKDTAAANETDPNQTVFDTLANMIKGGTGGDGTGPSTKEIKNKREAVKLLATQLGVVLTDAQINDLGYQYAAGQLDATTISPRIAKIGNIDFAMGEAANTISKLKSTAADFGVSYSIDWFTQSAKDVLTGTVDADTLTQAIKDLSKSRYPTLSKQIDAGYTVKQIASPYIQSMANTLEINPNDISLDDPTIKQAFTSLNSEGQPITKPLWEFEKELRRDERWRFTKNAQQDLMGTARKVLSDFGLVY
jgi:hypothetical protein